MHSPSDCLVKHIITNIQKSVNCKPPQRFNRILKKIGEHTHLMGSNLKKIGEYNRFFNLYLPYNMDSVPIYQSTGLVKHILKRHPECLKYMNMISVIISSPDYIGINPNEKGSSFELVKVLSENIQIGIKLDTKDGHLYVATLHTITEAKLRHGIANGRLKKFDN